MSYLPSPQRFDSTERREIAKAVVIAAGCALAVEAVKWGVELARKTFAPPTTEPAK